MDCNFCHFKEILNKKFKDKKQAVLADGEWIEIYRYPKDINIYELSKKEKEKYFVCSFEALPLQCECD